MNRKTPVKKPRVVAIVGPTASGKSSLAVSLARRFGGEIISADSRQVYRGLDIGTEKISPREMRSIPHHLLDVANPKRAYSAAQFKKDAGKILRYIVRNGKTPVVVGGTGLYIDTLLSGREFPDVPPNTKLRKKLVKKTPQELFVILQKLDPRRARTIDKHNPRRLERAIEIATALGNVPKQIKKKPPYEVLWIGLSPEDKKLRARLAMRLAKTLQRGLIRETEQLRKKGLSWKRLNELGLEYRLVAAYLRQELSKEELSHKLRTELWRYAKRQKTWFKRNKNVQWFKPEEKAKIKRVVETFLKK